MMSTLRKHAPCTPGRQLQELRRIMFFVYCTYCIFYIVYCTKRCNIVTGNIILSAHIILFLLHQLSFEMILCCMYLYRNVRNSTATSIVRIPNANLSRNDVGVSKGFETRLNYDWFIEHIQPVYFGTITMIPIIFVHVLFGRLKSNCAEQWFWFQQ